MTAVRALVLAVLVGGSACFLLWVDQLRRAPLEELVRAPGSGAGSPVAPAPVARNLPLPFLTSADCASCHVAVAAEWRDSPHSRPWGTHPHIPRDPLRVDCSPCHIPDKIYEHGLDQPAVLRPDRHHEGIGCIACHVKGDEVLGSGETREAPCNPRHEPTIARSVTCTPCHALHGTLDEWRASRFGPNGDDPRTCQDCHMPAVTRSGKGVTGDGTRAGRSHRILGGRDLELLREALTVLVRPRPDGAEIRLTNDRTGHAVPGEINNRKLVLHWTVVAPGDLRTERQRGFQAPPRPKRGLVPTTQIMPGQTVRQAVRLPPIARLESALEYRLFWLAEGVYYQRRELTVLRLPGWSRQRLREVR